jgi:hypothetical protein
MLKVSDQILAQKKDKKKPAKLAGLYQGVLLNPDF